MWNKFLTTNGNLCLTKRTITETEIKEEKFWFKPTDADFADALALCERLGI